MPRLCSRCLPPPEDNLWCGRAPFNRRQRQGERVASEPKAKQTSERVRPWRVLWVCSYEGVEAPCAVVDVRHTGMLPLSCALGKLVHNSHGQEIVCSTFAHVETAARLASCPRLSAVWLPARPSPAP